MAVAMMPSKIPVIVNYVSLSALPVGSAFLLYGISNNITNQ